jgi:hypothetical protein
MCPCYSKTWIWSLDPYLIIITLWSMLVKLF